MRRLGAAALAAAAASGLLACGTLGGRPRREPPPAPLQIWVSPIVRWPAGADRDVEFAIENGTERTLEIASPDPAGARLAVFPGAGETPVCGVEPGERTASGTLRLGPGEQLPVRVDLEQACAALGPGEYRYELSYVASRPGGGTVSLPTRYGTLVVSGPSRSARRTPGALPRPADPRLP